VTRILGCLGLLALVSGQVSAQDSLLLRYTPEFGATVHRLFQTHTRMTTRASDGSPPGAGSRETVDLGEMVQVTAGGAGGEHVVHLAFDSLRTRVREGAGPWRETIWLGLDSLWVQAWLDTRLAVARVHAGTASPAGALLLHLLTGVPNLVFPDRWLRAGDTWTAEHTVPLAGVVARARGDHPIDSLVARTVIALDSLVPRTSDTLAFLRFSGGFLPVQAAAGPALSYGGGLAGTLVWSSGWSVFVSGAVRVRVNVHMRFQGPEGGSTEAVITLETTTRHRVRSET
jgi:hypothetical protein